MYDKSSVFGNDSLRPRSARAERPEFSRTVSADTATYKGLPWGSDGKTLTTQTLYLGSYDGGDKALATEF